MLSSVDLEKLIKMKKAEIEAEKKKLGLKLKNCNEATEVYYEEKENKCDTQMNNDNPTQIKEDETVSNNDVGDENKVHQIPRELERYLRRCLGLPVMLKAGEYSPNNPQLRYHIPKDHDAFVGLGEYEKKLQFIRKLRQKEYREYLMQQTKLKEELKKQQEKEKEISRRKEIEDQLAKEINSKLIEDSIKSDKNAISKIDASAQVGARRKSPLSVACQTDDFIEANRQINKVTEAEKELSPRTAIEPGNAVTCKHSEVQSTNVTDGKCSYVPSLFDEDAIKKRNMKVEQEALAKRRRYQEELKKQIAEQQRMKEENKIKEKIQEQIEARRLEEQLKMLQVMQDKEIESNRVITVAMKENAVEYEKKKQMLQREIDEETKLLRTHFYDVNDIKSTINLANKNTNSPNVSKKITPRSHRFTPRSETLTKKSESLTHKSESLTHKSESLTPKSRFTAKSDKVTAKGDKIALKGENVIPKIGYLNTPLSRNVINKKPFSTNIPKNSIFSPSYNIGNVSKTQVYEPSFLKKDLNTYVKEAFKETPVPLIRQSPEKKTILSESSNFNPNLGKSATFGNISKLKTSKSDFNVTTHKDGFPTFNTDLNSAEMNKVVDKWQIPAVQKNILATQSQGNILTQLGSIRRQLQFEQMRLDSQFGKKC